MNCRRTVLISDAGISDMANPVKGKDQPFMESFPAVSSSRYLVGFMPYEITCVESG